jgi:hypothetical protein
LIATGASTHCRRGQIVVRGSGVSATILYKYLADPGLRSRFSAARLHWKLSWVEHS